jgi:hypothetical protein
MDNAAHAQKAAFLFFPASPRGWAFRVALSMPPARFVAWKRAFRAVIDGFLGQG